MASMILGVHVSKVSKFLDDKTSYEDLPKAIEANSELLGINAAQVFLHGPQSMVPAKVNPAEMKAVIKSGINVSAHSVYFTVGIWKINESNKNTAKSIKALNDVKKQLEACKAAGVWGLVIHISKHLPETIAYVMKKLKPIAKKTKVKVLLEMVSSKSDPLKTYETPEKINNLTTLIGPSEKWWGWCVDTAHLWGAGVSEIKSYDGMKDWLNRLVFPNKILLFHLNGSLVVCGSGKDKHAIPFSSDDNIWHKVKPAKSGVLAIAQFAVARSIPMIMEINYGDQDAAIDSLDIVKNME